MLSGRIVSQCRVADVHADEDVPLLDRAPGRPGCRGRRPGRRGRRGASARRRRRTRGSPASSSGRGSARPGRRRRPRPRAGQGLQRPAASGWSWPAAADRRPWSAGRGGRRAGRARCPAGSSPRRSPTRTTWSPGWNPAASAGLPGCTSERTTARLGAVARLAGDQAVPGRGQPAGAHHLGGDPLHVVDRQGEADPLGPGPDRDVDPDQLAVDVDQRAARVARVDAASVWIRLR